jgi:hypothetical protein
MNTNLATLHILASRYQSEENVITIFDEKEQVL